MIELFLTIAAIVYGAFYSIKTKTFRFVYIALIMINIQLTKEPFFIRKNYALSILAFSFGLIHLYQFSFKKRIQDAFMFSLVFFILGIFTLIKS